MAQFLRMGDRSISGLLSQPFKKIRRLQLKCMIEPVKQMRMNAIIVRLILSILIQRENAKS